MGDLVNIVVNIEDAIRQEMWIVFEEGKLTNNSTLTGEFEDDSDTKRLRAPRAYERSRAGRLNLIYLTLDAANHLTHR